MFRLSSQNGGAGTATLHYRSEIDGLRALAVVPVVLFHAGFAGFEGGFVGVDVFFVISGFLITSIIHAEIQADRFTFLSFYERRIRRLLPPLMLVCLACLPFAWAWLLPADFANFSKSLVSVNLFISNFLFWREAGYFDTAAELKPLLHTWSLAVEEQFYITFPVLLLLMRRIRREVQILVLGVLVVASFALAEYASHAAPDAGFFLLPTRAWELGVGAILALAMTGRTVEPTPIRNAGALVGMLLIIVGVFLLDKGYPFPGRWALFPVVGTALVIACAVKGTYVARILSLGPVVMVGLLSYSFYLWHQPVFAFARIRLQDGATPAVMLGLIVLSLILAWLSWRFVERPFRDRRVLSRTTVMTGAVLTALPLIVVGFLGAQTGGFPQRIPPEIRQIASIREEPYPQGQSDCVTPIRLKSFDPERICVFGDHTTKAIMWGDSHARAAVPALSQMLVERGVSLMQVTTPGCTPVIGYEWEAKAFHCTAKLEQMRDWVLANSAPGDLVLIHGRWTNLLMPVAFDNQEGGVEHGEVTRPVINAAPDLWPHDAQWLENMRGLFIETMDGLVAGDRRVVLIYPVPEAGWDVPRYLAYKRLFGEDTGGGLSTNHQIFEERAARAFSVLDGLGEAANLVRVYPSDLFCNTARPGRCIVEMDGQPLYADDDHLASAGAAMLAKEVEQTLLAADWLK